MKKFKQITLPNFTGMGTRSLDEHNGAPYELTLVVKDPTTGQLEVANYTLKLTWLDAFLRWSIALFGKPMGYVPPQTFVVQDSPQGGTFNGDEKQTS